MNDKLKLFKVDLRDYSFGSFYVIADNAGQAYQKVRAELDARDLGFREGRALKSVELIAEDAEYPECKTRLML
jgi:hypothetical protein